MQDKYFCTGGKKAPFLVYSTKQKLQMKTQKELIKLISANTQLTEVPSDGNMYYGIYDNVTAANNAAINRINKPQDWSLLYDGSKFMIARDKNVKEIMGKYKSWKLVGAYDSEAFIKKKLIDVSKLSKQPKTLLAEWTPFDLKELKNNIGDLIQSANRLDSVFMHTKNAEAQAIMLELHRQGKKIKEYAMATYQVKIY